MLTEMRTEGLSGLGALVGWTGLLCVTIAGLGAAGDGVLTPPPVELAGWHGWLAARTPVEAAFALGRLGVLAAAWYLLAATVLGVVVRIVRLRSLVAGLDRLTLPALRRLLDAAVGATLLTAVLSGVATAGQPVVPERVPADSPADLPPSQPRAAAVPAVETTWTVTAGEHFWGIAAQVLTDAWPQPPDDRAVSGYWQALVDRNRADLAAPGNPDLIYPGQVFRLPPIPVGDQ